jgi:Asp/Glu/hydantoin racemase
MGLRLWYQSSLAVGTNPVFKPYEDALARNVREVARPDTTVDIRGVSRASPHSASRYARYLNAISITRHAVEAQATGYDAIAVGCYTDPCLAEVRDTVAIPSLYIMQTSMHVACMLGEKFALLGHGAATLRSVQELVHRYRLEHRLAAVGRINARLSQADEWFRNPDPIIDQCRTEARKCIAQGADVLIPACGVLNQVLRENKIGDVDGCPVLDGSSLLLKFTEAMAELHRVAGTRWWRGNVSAQMLGEIDRAYGVL